MISYLRLIAIALVAAVVAVTPIVSKQSKQDAGQQVIIAEGTGIDEKEARKAAFRDAVSRIVGTLVDAETLVKNDEVIKERILEFSGGFVKTYETLKTEQVAGGLFRVQIKATVERLQIVTKLQDFKVAIKEVKGSDLLAEKMTKEEARKNATELLAKLYSEMPKVMKAEVRGKPRLTDKRDGVVVDILVSVDKKAYDAYIKRAIALFDKIAIEKSSAMIVGNHPSRSTNVNVMTLPLTSPLRNFPKFGESTPSGYAIWLCTSIDSQSEKMRWNYYWIDADFKKSLGPIIGDIRLHLSLTDADGMVISEDESQLHHTNHKANDGYAIRNTRHPDWPRSSWLLMGFITQDYKSHREKRTSATVYIAPLILFADPSSTHSSINGYRLTNALRIILKMSDDELSRVKQITSRLQLHPFDAKYVDD